MPIKIRIELSSLAAKSLSGVANYTKLLAESLSGDSEVDLCGTYFNFLNRQPIPIVKLKPRKLIKLPLMPLRVYTKLQSHHLAPAYDIALDPVDLAIFPNFATWPTINAHRSATVIHDLTYLYFPEFVEEKNLAHLRRVVPRSINESDFIITVSESVKAELTREFNIKPSKCVVTPIPPDEEFFNDLDPVRIQGVKAKYNITKKYIYFIGNLEPRKNLETLIEAYRRLPQDIKNEYSLVLAGGKGWKTESTQRTLDEARDAGEDILHLGFIDQADSPALYQGASLFVMPSLYEGFGMPVLEAMASGTPVIASDIPVLREVGSNLAVYADPHSSQSFTDAIISSLHTPRPSRDELQKNVRRYSWSDNVKKILSMLT